MKGKISRIKNTKGELALPITTVEAIYMEDGTTKLSDEIKDVLKYEEFDGESVTTEIPSVKEEINGIKKDISEINSSLDTKASYYGEYLLKAFDNNEIKTIDLIGDSITVGVGASGGGENTSGNIIFTDPSTGQVYKDNKKDSRCWANYFEEFIKTKYPNVEFMNRGIAGKSLRWGNGADIRPLWIRERDLIVVMLGTNDRSAYVQGGIELFKQHCSEFLSYIKSKCKYMVVMTATPSNSDYLEDGNVNPQNPICMNQIDMVITEVCKENNYVHISHYKEFFNAIGKSLIPIDECLELTGSHPNDKGYAIMWQIFQQYLGLCDTNYKFKQLPTMNSIWYKTNSVIKFDTPLTSELFKVGYTIVEIQTTDREKFPNGDYGTLFTFKSTQDISFSYQTFKPINKNEIWIRYWNKNNSSYSNFNKVGITVAQTVTVECGTIEPNSFKNIEIPFNSRDINMNVTITSTLNDGLMCSVFYHNGYGKWYARLLNITNNQVVQDTLQFKIQY